MDQRERNTELEEVVITALEAYDATHWSAMPAEVISVDLVKLTCNCQVQVQVKVRSSDGTMAWTQLPPLVDVPLVFPQGGPWLLTFPVTENDEVLVIFADRCIDSWWSQQSQVGPTIPPELRFHDLSDGFAIPGIRSLARPLTPPVSASDVQLRSADGTCMVDLAPSGAITLKAPGGLVVQGDIQVTGKSQLGNDVNVTGKVVASGEGTFNTIPVSTHLHTGVTTGLGNTGGPIP